MSVKTFVDCIAAAEATTKREPKMEALRTLDEDGKRLVQEALNPYRIFGIKKWPKITKFADVDIGAQAFFDLLDALHARELTGNDARDAVIITLSSYTENSAKYLARVIDKNLKCGVTETTVNKVFPDLVPTFGIMLAKKVESNFKFTFPVLAEFKMDGQRLAAKVKNSFVEYISRSGKPSDFCKGLFDEELFRIEQYVGYPFVIDNEVLATDFTETMNAKSSTNDDAKSKLRLFAFDFMSLEDWDNQRCLIEQMERSTFLENIITTLRLEKVVKTASKVCHNYEELFEFYNYALKMGFEGLILKNMTGLYEWDRSENWYKWKPIIDVDLEIVGIYAGKDDTKNEGLMGGFNLEGYDENNNHIITNCGSLKLGKKDSPLDVFIQQLVKDGGYDLHTMSIDDEGNICKMSNDEFFRTYVMRNQNEFLGRTAHIQAQELSKAKDRPDCFALRFPVLYNIRDDK